MTYMIAAYLIIWLATFALVFSINRRQTDLQRELATLQEAMNEKQGQR